MDKFLDSWHSYQFKYCFVNNSGLVKKQRFFGYTYKIDRIILYGSYARGDFNLESDVDIIIFIRLADVLCSAIHFPL